MTSRFRNLRFGCTAAVLFLSLAAFIVFLPVEPYAESDTKRHLLVLHSYHRGYKWTDDITSGIESVLKKENQKFSTHYEYMDTKRISDETYLDYLYNLYRYKYRDRKFDVILSSDNDAFDFLVKHRDELFPDTPVVFCGVNYFDMSMLQGKGLFTGVNEEADIKSTLDLALRHHPGTKQIAVINDTTTTGLVMHRKLMALLPEYQNKARFIFLEDKEMPEILDTVQKLPADSLVLLTIFTRDKAGRTFEYDETATLVTDRSRVPVYSVWDFYLGYGIVGGMLTSGYYQGEAAARMAVRVLHGEKVENIPIVMKSPNRYMFDYRQLKRFGLFYFPLPEGSTVINEPSPLYSVPKSVVRGTVAALACLLLTALLLLRKVVRHKRSEEESREEQMDDSANRHT